VQNINLKNRFTIRVFAVVAAMLMMTSMASARGYGAIAYSSKTGAHGWSHSYSSRHAAESAALRSCRAYGRGCRIIVWELNSCAAVAVSPDGGWGWGLHQDRWRAQAIANAECEARNRSCSLLQLVCD